MCLYKPQALPMLSSFSSQFTKHWQSWSSGATRLWPRQEEVITQRRGHVFQPHHRFKWGWKQQRSKKSGRHPSFKVNPEQLWCPADYYLCRRPNRVHMARVLWRWDSKISWKKVRMEGTTNRGLACITTSSYPLLWLWLSVLTGNMPSHQTNGINSTKHSAQSTFWEMSLNLESSISLWNGSVLKGLEFVSSLISFQWLLHCHWVLNHVLPWQDTSEV